MATLALLRIILLVISASSTDYLDHVTCTYTNVELFGITNDSIHSLDGNTRMTIQMDGNLVLRSRVDSVSNWLIQWQTNSYTLTTTSSRPAFVIQKDGNMVIYTNGGQGWVSATYKGGQNIYTLVVNNGGYAYLLDNTQSVIWSTNNTISSYPTYNILPTQYPSMPPTTHRQCVYSHESPIEIVLNQVIGAIQIRNVMEVSFDLKIRRNTSSCPSERFCHIFGVHTRFPLIFTSPQNEFVSSFMLTSSSTSKSEISDVYNILTDGKWHNLYFKYSFTERVVMIDNIMYVNIQNGPFDHSYFINQTYPITTVWGNPSGNQYVHNGTIKNLCINSVYNTLNPTISPTINPSHSPTINPSDNPTFNPSYNPTLDPSTSPTSPTSNPSYNPSRYPTILPTNIPSINPSVDPSFTPTTTPTYHRNVHGDGQIIETTQITINDTLTHIKNITPSNTTVFWPIMITFMILIFICILCILLFIRKKINDDKAVDIHTQQKGSVTQMSANISNDKNDIHMQSNDLCSGFDEINENENINGTNSNSMNVNDDLIIQDNHETPNGNYNQYMEADDDTPNTESTGESDHPLHINNSNITPHMPYDIDDEQNVGINKMNSEIEQWLHKIRLPQYYECFVQNGYISTDIIMKQIKDRNMLNDIGIVLKGHQTKIMAEIKRLSNENNNVIAYQSVFNHVEYEGNDAIIIGDDENDTVGDEMQNDINSNVTPN